jgi:hypothetical protein
MNLCTLHGIYFGINGKFSSLHLMFYMQLVFSDCTFKE